MSCDCLMIQNADLEKVALYLFFYFIRKLFHN